MVTSCRSEAVVVAAVRAPGAVVIRVDSQDLASPGQRLIDEFDMRSSGGACSWGVSGVGSWRRLSSTALVATMRLEPDIVRAAISGRRTSPKAGWKTSAAMGRATAL